VSAKHSASFQPTIAAHGCYEQTQESLALLKMQAQSSHSFQEGRSKSVKTAFADIRKRVKESAE
jgi:hypothetical protein